ncbi:MAG: hypothetical protein WC995_03565 [Lysobacteraceae bacterium]
MAGKRVIPKSPPAQVADLVARLRRKGSSPEQAGFVIERYAAETTFVPAGRGKYSTGEMVMSLIFDSLDTQAVPIGFLITCPVEIVRHRYGGAAFPSVVR